MGEYYPAPQPFGNQSSLDDEMVHDPGNSPHWSVPYALTGPVDTAVYQSVQLAYPESSQRTIVSPNAYMYYPQVRATQHSLSVPHQLPREPYELGQAYYPAPYDYTAFPSLTGSGTYENADPSARDEGMPSH